MTIRDAAYQLCKAIWTSPDYEQIHNLVWSLVTVTEEKRDTDEDCSWYGYFQQHLAVQFLSYLLIDAHRSELVLQTSLPMPQLSTLEIRTLTTAHMALKQLNRLCIGPLLVSQPSIGRLVDPYAEYNLALPADTLPLVVVPEDAARLLAVSFHNHPAIAKIIETESSLGNLPEQYLGASLQIEKTLLASGTQHTPDDFSALILHEGKNSQYRRLTRHLISLFSVRKSLWVLNQLVFHAFISKKLPVLDQNNVIDISSHSNSIAHGHTVLYQLDEKNRFLRPDELVFLFDVAPEKQHDGLCVVETSNLHHSRDSGTTIKLTVRCLDENLNYYPIILDYI